jgi:hypothetical protein
MLQNFKHHCSLRFSPEFFATQKAVVEAAGFEFGEGFIKLPYAGERTIIRVQTDHTVPHTLVEARRR